MTSRTTIHRTPIRRRRVVALLLALAAVAAAIADQLPAASHTTEPSPGAERRARPIPPGDVSGAADGAVPDRTSVFDDGIPGVAKLDPALLGALRRAATDATRDGVAFVVDSGWRSRRYQQRLLDEAIVKYGSEGEAARWVATPDTSQHVSGDAVDLGPSDAAAWLSRHGAAYGLCRIYGNEPWHFELRPGAVEQGCPPAYPDPTHDPRMR